MKSVFASSLVGRLFHWLVNHELSEKHSSIFSDDWIRPSWFPGVIPSPSVVNAQSPVITLLNAGSLLPIIKVACGMLLGASCISVFDESHFAHCLASHFVWRLFRKARSASEPSKASSLAPVLGRISRHFDRLESNSFSSPKANSENAGDAMSRVVSAVRCFLNSSTTRSVPLFLINFIKKHACPQGVIRRAGATY